MFKTGWDWAKKLTQAAQAQATEGQFTEAIETISLIEFAFMRSMTLVEVAQAQANAGQLEDARTTFTLAGNATGLAERKLHLVDRMYLVDTANYRSRLLRSVASGPVKAGQVEDARTTLALAVNAARLAEDALYRADALVSILEVIQKMR